MASEVAVPAATGSEGKQRTLLGHPLGLYVLFFTEMWERFSYYGMRGLLVLYMVHFFLWTQKDASRVYKWYTALVYLTPLLGGYLADRYLGNKKAVIIGAVLMAIGHFLMASTTEFWFYAALVFLIFGNGFFKPNMSTQVGRLYPANDPRLDGAYTIFYMGINLGAFLSPLVCGWLAENTIGRFHAGFAAAGIGMVIGLLTYLLGHRWVREIHESRTQPAGHGAPAATQNDNGAATGSRALTEAEAERTPSSLPFLNHITPGLMVVLGCGLAVLSPLLAPETPLSLGGLKLTFPGLGWISWDNVIALEIAALCSLVSAWITSRVQHAVRDRILAIYVLGIFVVCFWAAYEQAGNVLNLWADKDTDRVLFAPAPPPDIYPEPQPEAETMAETGQQSLWQRLTTMFEFRSSAPAKTEGQPKTDQGYTIPAPWFQSINAAAIFVLAPVFAFLWTWLERRRFNPSIATKMGLGLVFMALSVAVMISAARQEDRPSTTPLQEDHLPGTVGVNAKQQLYHQTPDNPQGEPPYHSGRLFFDPATHRLTVRGVFTDLERDQIARDTAPPEFVQKVKELQEKTEAAKRGPINVSVRLDHVPPGFDMEYSGFNSKQVTWDEKTQTLTARTWLQDKEVKALLVAGGDPGLRATLDKLVVDSSVYRVSPWWLFWSYILETIGELCLSPVGLSMVSKLAPARFATMLMGLWLVTSFFGNFMAGAIGEAYESVTPTNFFLLLTVGLSVASVILFFLVRKIVALMH
ncbi:MAG: peptide MFS transporter, partial [Planctomycetes bacterium]|nr:peptide MFS transporter [Planctomycetota bacterium]